MSNYAAHPCWHCGTMVTSGFFTTRDTGEPAFVFECDYADEYWDNLASLRQVGVLVSELQKAEGSVEP